MVNMSVGQVISLSRGNRKGLPAGHLVIALTAESQDVTRSLPVCQASLYAAGLFVSEAPLSL